MDKIKPAKYGLQLWSREYSMEVDKLSIEKSKIPALLLMENAGRSAAHTIMQRYHKDIPIIILAGPGNNGGDALVAARHLFIDGYSIKVIIVSKKENTKYTESCKTQIERLKEIKVPFIYYEKDILKSLNLKTPIILDGVLGLGVKEAIRESLSKTCLEEAATLTKKTVIAIDIPSGLDANNWTEKKAILPANLTITFGGMKPAHIISPSRGNCGEIQTKEIGFSEQAIRESQTKFPATCYLLDDKKIISEDPWTTLSQEAHKYDRGHILIIGGSSGKYGAPILSGMSALKAGAGCASLALPTIPNPIGVHGSLELTYEDLFLEETIDTKKLESFVLERKVKTIIIGSGTVKNPLNEKSMELLSHLNHHHNVFIVLDAGAIHGLQLLVDKYPLNPEKSVITPHPGEWNKFNPSLEANDLKETSTLSSKLNRWGITLLYKSATPMVFSPSLGNSTLITNSGSNSLAKAGTGDILTGIIGAHGAMNMIAPLAAIRAQVLINITARNLQSKLGVHGIIATDIVKNINKQ